MAKRRMLLEHNISCSMDMIYEFSDGISGLFMNAQEILSETKEILNTINGIAASIPGEALYGGLIGSVKGCLAKIAMCDMGATGYVITGLANKYVDNMYTTDKRYAELIRERAAGFNLLKELIKEREERSEQKYWFGGNRRGITMVRYDNPDLLTNNISKENKELQDKLYRLESYNNVYNHVQDQKARDYYLAKVNQYFREEIEYALPRKMESESDWEKVGEISKACKYVTAYNGAFTKINNYMNVIENIESTSSEQKEAEKEVEILYKEVLLASFLKKIEIGSIYNKYGEKIDNPNLIKTEDGIKIKVQNAGDGGITIGYGYLIKTKEDAEKYGFNIYGTDNTIEEVKSEIERQRKEYGEGNGNPAMLSEDDAEKLLMETLQEKKDYAKNLVSKKEKNFAVDNFTINEMNGFTSSLYIGGNINDDESFLYYLVRKDQEGAIQVIKEAERKGIYDKQEGRLRRRLMEYNIFFNGDYTYYEDTELETLKEELGYYE